MHDQLKRVPGRHTAQVLLAAVAAATATESHPVFVAPWSCRFKASFLVPQAALAAAPANGTKRLALVNRGSDGTGSTEIAAVAGTGLTLTAFDRYTLTTSADTVLAAGDVVALEYAKVGSGALIPESICQVEYEPDYSVAP